MSQDAYFESIRSGDLQRLRRLLHDDPGLVQATTRPENAPGKPLSCTGLHVAVHAGQPEAARILVQAGADIEARTEEGRTALLDSIEFGVGAITEMLLERGAELDVCAASVGHVEVGMVLIDHGADPDEIFGDAGGNALHAAVSMHYTDDSRRFVGMLLDHGANIDACTRDGRTALRIAETAAGRQVELLDPGDDEVRRKDFPGVAALLRRRGAKLG